MDYAVAFQIYRGFALFIRIISWALWGYVILSWIASPTSRVYRFLANLLDPLLYPIRSLLDRILKRPLPVDISPIVLSVLLHLLLRLIAGILFRQY